MADVWRAPALATGALAVAARRRRRAVAPFGKLKAKRSADRVGFGEPQGQALADAVGLAGFVADELLRALVLTEIFAT
jgi:hypothetical protein